MAGLFGGLGAFRKAKGAEKEKAASSRGSLPGAIGAFFRLFFKLVWVNLMFIGFALLLVTAGPACTGLAGVARDVLADKPLMATSDFWDGMKHNFKKSVLSGALLAICLFISQYALRYYFREARGGAAWMYLPFGLSLLAVLFLTFFGFYLFLLLATADDKLIHVLRSAATLSVRCLPSNLLTLVLTGGIGVFLWNFPFAALIYYTLIGFSVTAFIVAALCGPNIEKHVPAPQAPKPGQEGEGAAQEL